MNWQDKLRLHNAEKKKIPPEDLEHWIKAAEQLGVKIIVGPGPKK